MFGRDCARSRDTMTSCPGSPLARPVAAQHVVTKPANRRDELPSRNGNLGAREMLDDWIYNSPTWLSSGVFILCGIVVAGVVVVVMTWLIGAESRHAHNEVTAMTVANIAVLYTVLLAFIAVAAWESLSKASDIAGAEAGIVQDLYVDSQGLSDKELTKKLQNELRGYIDAVVNSEWPEQQGGGISRAAAPVLRDVRATLASLAPKTAGDGIVMQEMLRSLNELYETRRSRLDAVGGHIPDAVWWVVIFLGGLTIAFTGLLGMRSRWMHFALAAGLTTAIVVVVSMIVQLDYPFRGEISVSADPFRQVLKDVRQESTVGSTDRSGVQATRD
jgi:hypothetical protein